MGILVAAKVTKEMVNDMVLPNEETIRFVNKKI